MVRQFLEVKTNPLFSNAKEKYEVKANCDLFLSLSRRAVSVPVLDKDYYMEYNPEFEVYEVKFRTLLLSSGHGIILEPTFIAGKGVEIQSKTGDIDENAYLRM
jgi:hypothetical protein